MIDSKILEQYPPALRVNITPDKVAIHLQTLIAWGNDAAELTYEFQKQYDDRLNAAIAAARNRFFKSPSWTKVESLRAKLKQASQVATSTEQLLAEAQVEYSRLLAEGDPTSLLPILTARQMEAESSRKARNHFEKETEAAELAARGDLHKTIETAMSLFRSDARSQYRADVAALVHSIDPQAILTMAVNEKIVLSASGAALSPYGGPLTSTEAQNNLAIPAREQ